MSAPGRTCAGSRRRIMQPAAKHYHKTTDTTPHIKLLHRSTTLRGRAALGIRYPESVHGISAHESTVPIVLSAPIRFPAWLASLASLADEHRSGRAEPPRASLAGTAPRHGLPLYTNPSAPVRSRPKPLDPCLACHVVQCERAPPTEVHVRSHVVADLVLPARTLRGALGAALVRRQCAARRACRRCRRCARRCRSSSSRSGTARTRSSHRRSSSRDASRSGIPARTPHPPLSQRSKASS
jgi:hypothetical protein